MGSREACIAGATSDLAPARLQWTVSLVALRINSKALPSRGSSASEPSPPAHTLHEPQAPGPGGAHRWRSISSNGPSLCRDIGVPGPPFLDVSLGTSSHHLEEQEVPPLCGFLPFSCEDSLPQHRNSSCPAICPQGGGLTPMPLGPSGKNGPGPGNAFQFELRNA